MLLGQDEENNTNPCLAHEENMNPKEAIVSFHATNSTPQQSTMRFKGQVGPKPVCTLLDSGSTNSFVDPSVLHGQNIVVEDTKPLIVMVANGARMVTDTKCPSLSFSL
jgi:hypothetical protein